MEFVMKTDLEALPKAIEYNHEELKKQLAVELEKYQNIVVTENDISNAKADRANLNKFKEALDTKRKEVKKQCVQPYEVFEKNIKEIIRMVEEPIKAIDSQIKYFENQKKEEKKEEIEGLYQDEIGELKELIPLERLWNQKWLNATYKLPDIALDIEVAVNRIRSGMQIIKDLHCEFEKQIIDKFLQTLDINTALMENKRLETQKRQLEELQKQQETKAKQAEGKKGQEEIQLQKIPDLKNQPAIVEAPVEKQFIALDFRVWVTAQQAQELKKFLTGNNIKYGRVPQVV